MKSRDSLIKQANIMMVAAVVTGFFNFLYQILMNRGLRKEDFADFYVLLGVFVILSVPSMTIQTVIAKRISQLRAKDDYAGMTRIFSGSLRRILILGTISLVLFVLVSSYLRDFLDIGSKLPVIVMGVALLFALLVPVGYGALQGLQKFTSLGLNLILSTLVRVGSGVLLVSLGFKVSGAIGSSIIFAIFAFGLALISLQPLFRQSPAGEKIDFLQMYRYSFPVLLAFFLLTLLSFVDMLLVNHFLKEGAADYSTASVLGRAIIYIPMAISMVMFPKVAEAEAKGENPSRLLGKSLLYSILLCLVASLFFFSFPKLIIRIFRPEYLSTAPPLLKGFGFALMPFGLIGILVYYNLAIHRMKFLYALTGGTILHIILLSLFHATLLQVILVLGLSGTIILGMMLAVTISKGQIQQEENAKL